MVNIIVIVVKNGTKYQIGLDKSVSDILNEIGACKSDFYQVYKDCAIKVDEIVSIEKFEYEQKEEEEVTEDD